MHIEKATNMMMGSCTWRTTMGYSPPRDHPIDHPRDLHPRMGILLQPLQEIKTPASLHRAVTDQEQISEGKGVVESSDLVV
jgi:hypothetical protein